MRIINTIIVEKVNLIIILLRSMYFWTKQAIMNFLFSSYFHNNILLINVKVKANLNKTT